MLAFTFLELHVLRVGSIGCDGFNKKDFLDRRRVLRYWMTEENSRAAFAQET